MAYPVKKVRMTKAAKAVMGRFVQATKAKSTVAKKVATLTKQVKKLNQVSYDKVMLKCSEGTNAFFASPYYQYPITAGLNNWTPIFGSNTGDIANVEKMYVNSYTVAARLLQNSEPDLIKYTAFVVSLKDEGADTSTFDPTTGQLILASDIHYTILNQSGTVELNTKFFNIHHKKRFYMGGRPGDQSAPVMKELSFVIKPKQRLVSNPRGNLFGAGGIDHPRDASQNYFFLLFNDNSLVDLESNRIEIQAMANVAIPS